MKRNNSNVIGCLLGIALQLPLALGVYAEIAGRRTRVVRVSLKHVDL
jgi:hypothetical protein